MSTATILEPPMATALRKRTKALQLPSESESPGSQLQSPLSSLDDNICSADPQLDPLTSTHPRRRRRSSTSTLGSRKTKLQKHAPAAKAGDAQWSDVPLAVSLIPPLGSFLTGGDFLRDFLLFILLFFYLHQLIKLPWELYMASRPRGRRVRRTDTTPDTQRLHDLAASELRIAEFCYLTFAVLAPILGAALLRYVGTVLTGRDYISWFSTGIFVLVTGVRPWRHLGRRLRARTEELQDVINTTSTIDLEERVKLLETELAVLRDVAATRDDVAALDEMLDGLDVAIRRNLRAVEGGGRAVEERLKTLERSIESVHAAPKAWTPSLLLDWVRPQATTLPRAPTANARGASRAGYRPRLESVREESDTSMRSRGQLQEKGHVLAWVEMLLLPFRIGKRLVWLFMDFLQRRVV